MINIEELYKKTLSSFEMTTKELKSVGLNSNDINLLIEKGTIKRVERGHYIFISADELYVYARGLIKEGNLEDAEHFFEKCIELNNKHLSSYFQLFLNAIKRQDYQKALEYYDVLYTNSSLNYRKDLRVYLVILNTITNLPDPYKSFAQKTRYKDVQITEDDNRFGNILENNNVRSLIINRRFGIALKKSLSLTQPSNLYYAVVNELLYKATKCQKEYRGNLNRLVTDEKYSELVSVLEERIKNNRWRTTDKLLLHITKTIIKIQDTNIVPEINNSDSTFANLVYDNNFKVALKQCINEEGEKDATCDLTLYLLLVKVCNLIEQLEKDNEENTVEDVSDVLDVEDKNGTSYNPDLYSSIFLSLVSNNLDQAKVLINEYLKSINKLEYEKLIVSLINLSSYKKDITYSAPMIALTYLGKGAYEINISDYIQSCYMAIHNQNYEEAKLYVEIIKCCNIPTDVFEIIISADKANICAVEEVKENALEDNIELENEVAPSPIPKTKTEPTGKSVPIDTISKEEKDYFNQKREKLLDGRGIVILKPMTRIQRYAIYTLAKTTNDVLAFGLGEGDVKRVVLKERKRSNEKLNYAALSQAGDQAYTAKNYDECIANYQLILQNARWPRAYIYAKLGLAYMKKFKLDWAVDYLDVATNISRTEGSNLDFTELIMRLRGEIKEEDKKHKVRFQPTEFNRPANDGIDNFDSLIDYMIANKADAESACEHFGFTEEQTNLVKLAIARRYYLQGSIDNADMFLKSVERCSNKTPIIKKILSQLIKEKKFLINKKESVEILSLVLKPSSPKNNL